MERKHRRLDVYGRESEILESFKSGSSASEIAKALKCDCSVIKNILNKNGIALMPKGFYMRGKPSTRKLNIVDEDVICLYNSGVSGAKIADKFNCNRSVIYDKLKKYDVKMRGATFFNKGKSTWNKGKSLSMKELIRVRNQFKNDVRFNFKGKVRTAENIEKIKLARAEQILPVKDTSIEIKIQNFLKQMNLEFFTHKYIKEIEHGYQCDILIPSMNLVIECDGNYWHKYPIGNDLDHVRTSELLQKGFKVLRLWESEIKLMTEDQFAEKILSKSHGYLYPETLTKFSNGGSQNGF